MKRVLVILLTVAFAIGATAMAATAAPDGENNGKKAVKVWICHFPGHDAEESWSGGGTQLDGDYVVNATSIIDGVPKVGSVTYCESRGGHLIEVNANSLEKGHEAQLLDRVDDY